MMSLLGVRLIAFSMMLLLPAVASAASYVVGNAQTASSLGRSLAGGANATRTISLIDSGTEFAEGWNTQLDFRLSEAYEGRGLRLQPTFDVFHIFNTSTCSARTRGTVRCGRM